ncbi:MAG TPA: helix-turn-helix transcriptional regulator [Allosphingosinicella sp.]|nr:helix-turn-helix transcriptional regulator [Allosphingosinicella sp.]
MAVQFIDIGGEKLAVMPVADYDRLVAEVEDRADEQAAAEAERRRQAGEEYLPAEMVDRLLAGESPLRVWRKHRGLTLKRLGEKAGLSLVYISQIEGANRGGSAKVWRKLATALDVDIDDILPQSTE